MDEERFRTISRHLIGIIFGMFHGEQLREFYEQLRKKYLELDK